LSNVPKLLDAKDLEIRRGERCLIKDLTFGLAQGELALIVGPNGSGKTSLLRVLAGLAPASSGRVTWSDIPIQRLEPEQRVDISYRGHSDGLKKDLTVRENLEFYKSLAGSDVEVDELLEALQLESAQAQQLRFLSAGQRRRVGLAALKVGKARLWLLDEPMTNLDIEGRKLVLAWINGHVQAGGLAVIATHQPDDLFASGTLLIEL